MAKKAQIRLVKINEPRHMVITPIARLSFPQLFEARRFNDDPKQANVFQCDLIFDSEAALKEPYKGKKKQTVSLRKAVFNAKVDQWGEDKEEWPPMGNPVFKKGDERTNAEDEVYQGYEGKFFVTAKSDEKFPPKVISSSGEPLEESDVYGGCYVRAQLIARPYAVGKNSGVRFILLQVMKVKDGERFGGVAEDVFDHSEAEDSDDDEGEDF